MVAEMDKLKTMVRKTEDRQQLGELMALVTEKATVAVAVKPEKAESKVPSPLVHHVVLWPWQSSLERLSQMKFPPPVN